jgi:hypothetical protein
MTPGLCLDSGEFIPAAELNRRIDVKTNHIEINNAEVICPNCCHQFGAIPVNVQKRIAELEAQLASGQEPVAWMTFDGEGGYDFRQFAENENYRDDFIQRNGEKYAWVVEPLYAHPAPAQQPLTGSALDVIVENTPMPSGPVSVGRWVLNVIRAVEAAHGIKEKP